MAERYKRLFELDSAKYADGAPLIVSAGVLLEDRLARSTLVQLKLTNISDELITAAKVLIEVFDPSGERLESTEYMYQGFSAERDQSFGQKTAVIVPDSRAAKFSVRVLQVMFANGRIWDGPESEWDDIRSPKTLTEAYGDEQLSTQFSIRYGSDCSYMPDDDRGLWFCACGLINREDETKCHGCRRVYSALKSVNIASLRTESIQRQETERQIEEEDKAETDHKRKKAIILGCILIPVIALAILILATVPRYMVQKKDYANAAALLSAGKYDQAQEAFRALGDYDDSAEQAEYNVIYQKALYVMDCAARDDVEGLLMLGMKRSELPEGDSVSVALYKEADKLFAQLGEYKDSVNQRGYAQQAVSSYYEAIKEGDYQAAVALLESGSYLKAREALSVLGDYKDCTELMKESLYRRAVRLYELTDKYSMQGIYSSISSVSETKSIFYMTQDAFTRLGSNASSDIRDIFREDGVEVNIGDAPAEGFVPVCQDLSRLFKELGDYKDSAEYAEKAILAGDYTRPFYELCEAGQLYEAYLWLEAFKDEFEAREQWMSVLQKYIPYCGSWSLNKGDPTLIPMMVGVEVPCNGFVSAVVIKDYVVTLVIYVNGNMDYPISMPLAAEGGRFSSNVDGVNTYIAALSNTGRFNFSRYSSYAISAQTNSCEYSRAG